MLVSFAAALRDGVSLSADVTRDTSEGSESQGSISAKVGLSQLFSSLFEATAEAKLEGNSSEKNQEIIQERKSHTEASIAIVLYSQMKENGGYIETISDTSDFENLDAGSLVEISGIIEKNAVDTVIDYLEATIILSRMDTSTGKKPAGKHPLNQMKQALDDDRKRTPISNSILRCETKEKIDALVTLRTDNLRDLTLSELNKNRVTVVGKVTRVIPQGEKVSTFENYGLSMIDESTLVETFRGLEETEGVNTKFSDVFIDGPSLQILPLMIFV